MEKAISIIIVDDHPLFRKGIVDTLSSYDDLLIVAEASDGEEGLRLIRGIRPMVAIIDVNLPEMNGQQLTRQVIAEKISTRVLLLTAYDDREQKIHAMQVGASGYCTKDILPDTLAANIQAIADGKYVVDNQMYDRQGIEDWLNARIERASRRYSVPGDPYQPLSNREMQVLEYVTLGRSNKEIAMALNISQQTVKNHVTAILRKLVVEDRTQAAIFALRQGWVRLYDQDIEPTE